jgi:hypothetical protein
MQMIEDHCGRINPLKNAERILQGFSRLRAHCCRASGHARRRPRERGKGEGSSRPVEINKGAGTLN